MSAAASSRWPRRNTFRCLSTRTRWRIIPSTAARRRSRPIARKRRRRRRCRATPSPAISHWRRSCSIVFTNGCFDLIHLGHVKYFQFARAQGDLLVVGVNTDASIRGLKGPKRPIINEHDRIEVLEELESIDYLVRFDEETPLRLIEAV